MQTFGAKGRRGLKRGMIALNYVYFNSSVVSTVQYYLYKHKTVYHIDLFEKDDYELPFAMYVIGSLNKIMIEIQYYNIIILI